MADHAPQLEEEVRRARRSREILEDPMIKQALVDMETAIIDNIATCPPAEERIQQKLCMLLGVTRQFKQIFQTHLETGKMAEFQLEQKKKGIFHR